MIATVRSPASRELGDGEAKCIEAAVQADRFGGEERHDQRPPSVDALCALVELRRIERRIRSVVQVSDQLQVSETAVGVLELLRQRAHQRARQLAHVVYPGCGIGVQQLLPMSIDGRLVLVENCPDQAAPIAEVVLDGRSVRDAGRGDDLPKAD